MATTYLIDIADSDVPLLEALAATENTDVEGLIALKSTQLVQFRKDAVVRALLSSRIAKLLHAGPIVLNALDNVVLPDGTTVDSELTKALAILRVRR